MTQERPSIDRQPPTRGRLAVVGGGWAGLAAAVQAVERGFEVSLFEMAPQLGGRARSVVAQTRSGPLTLDNGQHVMIGAYRDTLALMEQLGVVMDQAVLRQPLKLIDPQGVGLKLPSGPPSLAFLRGVWAASHWRVTERMALLRAAWSWQRAGFACDGSTTVAELTQQLPQAIRRDVVDPLCVAALNTPAEHASARVFLRVLRDALFSGPGGSDMLLPKVPLAGLLPNPAQAWLSQRGVRMALRTRVQSLRWQDHASGDATSDDNQAADRRAGHWLLDAEAFDAVVLACSANEAARLVSALDPVWASTAARVPYQSIVTVYAHHPEAKLVAPMVALQSTPDYPAQFVFDHGMLSGRAGLLAFVVSGANEGLAAGQDVLTEATLAQARQMLPRAPWLESLSVVATIAERRATFACRPDIKRPGMHVGDCKQLTAAGDYIDGPYPATLEGAVRSGRAAVEALVDH
jgi:hydroxysqualene dehydroxylase